MQWGVHQLLSVFKLHAVLVLNEHIHDSAVQQDLGDCTMSEQVFLNPCTFNFPHTRISICWLILFLTPSILPSYGVAVSWPKTDYTKGCVWWYLSIIYIKSHPRQCWYYLKVLMYYLSYLPLTIPVLKVSLMRFCQEPCGHCRNSVQPRDPPEVFLIHDAWLASHLPT